MSVRRHSRGDRRCTRRRRHPRRAAGAAIPADAPQDRQPTWPLPPSMSRCMPVLMVAPFDLITAFYVSVGPMGPFEFHLPAAKLTRQATRNRALVLRLDIGARLSKKRVERYARGSGRHFNARKHGTDRGDRGDTICNRHDVSHTGNFRLAPRRLCCPRRWRRWCVRLRATSRPPAR